MEIYLYIGKRLLMSLGVVVLLVVGLAAGPHLVPGNPAITLAQRQRGVSDDFVLEVREHMGLNDPIWETAGEFLISAPTGDFGTDFISDRPISELIGNAFPHTFFLALAAVLVGAIIGIPLGVFIAARPNGIIDRATAMVSVATVQIPVLVPLIGLMLIFSVRLHWFPLIGSGSFSEDPLDYLRRMVLPVFALAFPGIGVLPRLIRANMLEVMGSDYIRAARSFGLRERSVFYKYGLKNAMIPVAAYLGLELGGTLAGTVFAEIIFGRAGLGSLAVSASAQYNWPLIRATTLVFAVFIMLANLLADLSLRLLDPRIRVELGEAPA
jgi:peptide/nickel transport system permease protein